MKRVVFISHSSADLPVAERLCTYLEENGVACWIAPRDVTPGKNYGAAIVDAIDECRVFVLILSSQSNKSRQVVREVERAASTDSVILPFRIEDVQPSRDLAFYVSSAHWLDATKQPVDEQFDELLTAIRGWQRSEPGEEEKTTPPPPLPAPPPISGATRQPGYRITLFIAAGLAAAIAVGALVFYKLRQPKEKEPSSQLELAVPPSPSVTPSPTATPLEPSPSPSPTPTPTPTPTATETPSPTPPPSPTATPIRLKPGERLRPNAPPESTIAPPTPTNPPLTPRKGATPLSAVAPSPPPPRPVVREVAASSHLDSEHRPNYAFDGNRTTGWVTKGSSTGQTLFAHFKSPAVVSSVSILNGDGRDEDEYRAGNRVKTLRIVLSDGTNQLLTFKDKMEMQRFKLAKPVTASWVKFEIVSVYSGKTKRTGISEIAFNEAEE